MSWMFLRLLCSARNGVAIASRTRDDPFIQFNIVVAVVIAFAVTVMSIFLTTVGI
jgi:hypothetical protein